MNVPRAGNESTNAACNAVFDIFYGCFPNTRHRYEWSSLDKFYAMQKAADFHSHKKIKHSIHYASFYFPLLSLCVPVLFIPYFLYLHTHKSVIFVLRLFVNGLRLCCNSTTVAYCTINLCNMLTMLFQLFFSLFASIDSFSHCIFSLPLSSLRFLYEKKNSYIETCFDRE